jgi:urease accessory protein
MKKLHLGTLFACLLMTSPAWLSQAWAHAPIMGIGGVLGGALHALLLPEHGMSLVALGVFLGREQPAVRRQEALIFTAALVGGLVVIAVIGEAALAVDFLLLTTAILGLLIAVNWAPRFLGWLLAAIVGVALALDSPPEVSSTGEAIRMLFGSGLGAAVAVVVLVEAAAWYRAKGPLIALRVLGSWIAAIAILVLALRIATRFAIG